jgi:hypothetical protein
MYRSLGKKHISVVRVPEFRFYAGAGLQDRLQAAASREGQQAAPREQGRRLGATTANVSASAAERCGSPGAFQ